MENIDFKGKRVGIYVDLANVGLTVRNIMRLNQGIDYVQLVNCLSEGNNVTSCVVFDGEMVGLNSVQKEIKESGIELGLVKQYQNDRQKGVDMTMGLRMLNDGNNDVIDVAILVSGDADFMPVYDSLTALGKEVYFAAYDDALNARIRGEFGDRIINLEQFPIIRLSPENDFPSYYLEKAAAEVQ